MLRGEAVARGSIGAGLIGIEIGIERACRLQRSRGILEKLGVPVRLPPNLAEENLIDLIKRDKKAINKWPRFVLIDKIGGVYRKDGKYAVAVAPEVVTKGLYKLQREFV